MSEDEAKQTRCCGPNGCGEVQDDGTGSPMNQKRFCIGSACMAWRRNRDPDRVRAGISEYGGHCGLAGKP